MAKASQFDAADYLDSPGAIADYLSEAFDSGDEKLVARAFDTVAQAKGMTEVANETGLSRESLYRSLSEQGRPELATALKVLDSFDMQVVVRPKKISAA